MKSIKEGKWPENDLRRAFVAGAKWWEYYSTRFTMWSSDISLAEIEAEKRYGQTKCSEQETPNPLPVRWKTSKLPKWKPKTIIGRGFEG